MLIIGKIVFVLKISVDFMCPLRWRHNGHDIVSDHQPHDCLLNRLFRLRSKKTSRFRVTGLCAGNSPGTGEFPAQMASNAENVSIWWRHHVMQCDFLFTPICYHSIKNLSIYPLSLLVSVSHTNVLADLHPANERRRYFCNDVSHWLGANLELFRNINKYTYRCCETWFWIKHYSG